MWKRLETDLFLRKKREYDKKSKRELVAVMDNLDTYLATLNAGVKPQLIRHGFIHREKMGGVIAIDQRGGGKALRQTRLYVFADEYNKVLYLITLGDKRTQNRADIKACREFVTSLRQNE